MTSFMPTQPNPTSHLPLTQFLPSQLNTHTLLSSPMPQPEPDRSTPSSPLPSPSVTINLSQEYTLAIQTNSYNEVWSKIHASPQHGQLLTISHVLHPNRASVEEVLSAAPLTRMTRLVSRYFDSSEHASNLCLALREGISLARSVYSPIGVLLGLVPAESQLTEALCDLAFDTFVEFSRTENPFPSPSRSSSSPSTSTSGGNEANQFEGMRGSFVELKQQLDVRLAKARRKRRLLKRTTRGSGICLIGCTTGITIVGLVVATHAMTVMLAGSAFVLGSCGLFAIPKLKDDLDRLDAAARNTYVLNNDLHTIEKLVERLHATIESDRKLVKLGLEEGKGRRHPIEHVVLHLRNNYGSLVRQLSDLDEHICLYFASVNRARSVLLQHVSQAGS